MEMNLRGRKAFVTGASRGIGAAIARGLAEEGVDVALFTRNPSDCETLSKNLGNAHGVKAPIIQLDFLERARIEPAVAEGIAALGGLDTLVFAGGIGENAPLIRERICEGLGFLGIDLDLERNAENAPRISRGRACVRVIHTDEEVMLARSIARVLDRPSIRET